MNETTNSQNKHFYDFEAWSKISLFTALEKVITGLALAWYREIHALGKYSRLMIYYSVLLPMVYSML